MKKKNKSLNSGLTLVELLIGATLGIVILTSLMVFYLRTSKMISTNQEHIKSISQLQVAMNKIVEDIKEANSQLPETGTTVTSAMWSGLPLLPYGRTYLQTLNSDMKVTPNYPLIYNYDYQAGLSGTIKGAYPNPPQNYQEAPQLLGSPPNPFACKATGESPSYGPCYSQNPFSHNASVSFDNDPDKLKKMSNILVFYKVEGNQIYRIKYYAGVRTDHGSTPRFSRTLDVLRIQQPVTCVGSSCTTDISPDKYPPDKPDGSLHSYEIKVLRGVKYIQFTYPKIEKEMYDTWGSSTVGDLYKDIDDIVTGGGTTTQKVVAMNQRFRKLRDTIGIKIVAAGKINSSGKKRYNAFELNTEVKVRN